MGGRKTYWRLDRSSPFIIGYSRLRQIRIHPAIGLRGLKPGVSFSTRRNSTLRKISGEIYRENMVADGMWRRNARTTAGSLTRRRMSESSSTAVSTFHPSHVRRQVHLKGPIWIKKQLLSSSHLFIAPGRCLRSTDNT